MIIYGRKEFKVAALIERETALCEDRAKLAILRQSRRDPRKETQISII
jgi:hypothetical protein